MGAAFVQSCSGLVAPGTAATCTFTNPVSSGNLIALVIEEPVVQLTVTDNYGNTYVLIDQDLTNNGVSLYYAKNITGSGGLSNFAVTVTIGSTQNIWIAAHEVSGCDTTSPLDQHAVANGSGGSPSCGPVTTTVNGEYIFAAYNGSTGGSDTTPGPGFTARETFGGNLLLTEDQIQSAAGSIAGTFGPVPGTTWVIGMSTFKPAAGGAPVNNALFISSD